MVAIHRSVKLAVAKVYLAKGYAREDETADVLLLIQNFTDALHIALAALAALGILIALLNLLERNRSDAFPRVVTLYVLLAVLTGWSFLYGGVALGPALWPNYADDSLPGNPAVIAFLDFYTFLDARWFRGYARLIKLTQPGLFIVVPIWLMLFFLSVRLGEKTQREKTLRRWFLYSVSAAVLAFVLPSAHNIPSPHSDGSRNPSGVPPPLRHSA